MTFSGALTEVLRKKNNSFIMGIVDKMKAIKEKFNLDYTYLCPAFNIAYPTFMRWKERVKAGAKPVNKPGPKKNKLLDRQKLKEDLDKLKHGKKRSKGIEALKEKYKNQISRRDLDHLIEESRDRYQQELKEKAKRVQWHTPGIAWSMDDTEMKIINKKFFINNIQDMHSKYKFTPVAGKQLVCGEELAGHLANLFSSFGAPLFMKRDNGGNLNHTAVNQVLEEFAVIPLNSPTYYPKYNGSLEHYQKDVKDEVRNSFYDLKTDNEVCMMIELAFQNLNHKSRPVLNGNHSCKTFFQDNKPTFSKRKRKEVYQWIHNLVVDILENEGHSVNSDYDRIWRLVCQAWLQKNGHISVFQNGKLLPYFSEEIYHN